MIEGTVIGNRYAITRLLGEGGMGAVYEARHLGTGRKVALKVISSELSANASVVARLEAEAQAAGSIDSEHITQVVDVGRDEATDTPYLVMELLDGEDLGELLARLGPLDPTLVTRVAIQIAMGLEAAHARNIVHRDLKPANIFMSRRDGGEVKVKILDFGISKSLDADASRPQSNKLTKTGTIMGSPVYMSPEQTRAKNIDHRSDLWSFGVVLFELLTNTTPFDSAGAIADLIIDICTGRIPPVTERAPWTPAPLAAVIERALVRDPAQRWQSAHEMRVALEACVPEVRSMRASDLVAHSGASAIAPREGAPTGVATPVGAAAASAAVAAKTAIAPQRAPVATVAFDPSRDGRPDQRPSGTTSAAVIAAPPPAIPAKQSSPVLWLAGVAVVAGLGVGGFLLSRGGGSSTGTSASSPATPAPSTPPRVATSDPTASAPPSATAPTVDPKLAPLAALVGKWVSSKGNHFEAVLVGDAVEFRVTNPAELAGKGYGPNEPRFILRTPDAGGDGFAVTDHSRAKAPPGGAYEGGMGPASCAIELTSAGGAPLTAKLDGEKLSVRFAAFEVPDNAFVKRGAIVQDCRGLDKLPKTREETLYTREK
ncbi:MAG: serine/threonine-protein kinase [Polyangiaceae bacterium]